VAQCRTDRVALLSIFKLLTANIWPSVDNRVIFVSTHLARNPENENQTLLRIHQVSQQACGKRQPARCCTRQKTGRKSFHATEVFALLHRRAYTSACAFLRRVWHAFQQVFLSTMHVQVCMLDSCLGHQHTHLRTHSRQGLHMRSCMHSLFILKFSVGGRGWGIPASL